MIRPYILLSRNHDNDEPKLNIVGFAHRAYVHQYGIPHGAVQILVIAFKAIDNQLIPHFLLNKRSAEKFVDPNKWDLFGGHLELHEQLFERKWESKEKEPVVLLNDFLEKWGEKEVIEYLFWETALREANEEIHFRNKTFVFSEKDLLLFDKIGNFDTGLDSPNANNREYSSCFLAIIPKTVLTLKENEDIAQHIVCMDSVSVNGEIVDMPVVQIETLTLESIIKWFSAKPDEFADGISRVLKRLIDEPALLKSLQHILEEISCRN